MLFLALFGPGMHCIYFIDRILAVLYVLNMYDLAHTYLNVLNLDV